MHIYKNLNDDVKNVFLFRFLYTLILIVIDIYCISILITHGPFVFLIISSIFNFLAILNNLSCIWGLIYTNSTGKQEVVYFFDIIIGVLTSIMLIVYYVVRNFIIYELIVMIPYTIFYLGFVACVIIMILGCSFMGFYEAVIETHRIVEQRQDII
jgi:hypothetical protein